MDLELPEVSPGRIGCPPAVEPEGLGFSRGPSRWIRLVVTPGQEQTFDV